VLVAVIHDALVVSGDADGPLFQFSQDALTTLLSDPRDITLSACILETQDITILDKDISNIIEYFILRPTSKGAVVLLEITTLTKSTKITITHWYLLSMNDLRFHDLLGDSNTCRRAVSLFNHSEYLLNCLDWDFALNNISSIKTINAICSKNTTLCLYYFLLSKSLFDEKAKSSLNIANFAQ